ncbi:MAG: UDP-N-acetylglucosamine diphosphorylase/glucosamine-1-phosphate N-acetyltransferase [Flavobacteriales bacterium]|jgi:UDP-N-acetylglucosamine diphosphorylase/glucosamine-1-phosphate N-acetyltransferase
MHIILFEDNFRHQFLPLVFTRPVGELRVGIRTLSQQWKALLPSATLSHGTERYLEDAFPVRIESENLLINARVLPTAELQAPITKLELGTALYLGEELIAAKLSEADTIQWQSKRQFPSNLKSIAVKAKILTHITQLFAWNELAIRTEFERMNQKESAPISSTVTVIGDKSLVFIEDGASVEGCWLNTTNGPIYIGKDATVMEASVIYGPFALCDHATVKAGAKIYGATTIGPHSKVGGEVSNSVIQGYSNKGHDGFLGNSIIGEWCNIGADTNTSNLKNNYSDVSIWNYEAKAYPSSGLTFCGLIMGDHSKCGINTMFNTGTVVGVNANIFGSGFPPKFIPSFSWGGASGFVEYDFHKALEVAEKVMARRKIKLGPQDQSILRHIFDTSAPFRS